VPRFYDQVEMGDELGPVEQLATDQAVIDFCNVWEFPHARRRTFTDDEVAKSEGLPGAILPGIMSMAYVAQFLSQWAEGGSLKKLDVVFRQVVLHEQPLRLAGVVTDKNRVGTENQVECDVYMENAGGERLVDGKGTVVLPDRE